MSRSVEDPLRNKWATKITLLMLSFLQSTFGFAAPSTDIKLQCQLEIKSENFLNQYGQTSSEKKTETATVEILEFGKILSIGISGSQPMADVISKTTDLIKSFENRSTDSVWELSNERNHGVGKMRVKIRIDRNSGLLNYSSDVQITNSGWASETGAGYCSKVDTTKKKF
jgi:hypothetical protein